MPIEKSQSEAAMDEYVSTDVRFGEPRMNDPKLKHPTLPDLKIMAQERQAKGLPTSDQSAGDIADVGEPLASDFKSWRLFLRYAFLDEGEKRVFPEDHNSIYGIQDKYQAKWPAVADVLAKSWGINETPYEFFQANSGRAAIDDLFSGFKTRSLELNKGKKPVFVLDPVAWPGYKPLAKDLGIEIVYAPTTEGRGLQMSAGALEETLQFVREKGLAPAVVISILPSNPTGVGMPREELKALVEKAAENNVPVMIDGFYSPLDPAGHQSAVPMDYLERELAPEVLKYLSLLVGETKVVSSSVRTATAFSMAPKGHEDVAKTVIGEASRKEKAKCEHPNPEALLTAVALHSYEGGIHKVMGPRYQKLEQARQTIRSECDRLGLPLSIGGSFYGVAALVDPSGESLIRDDSGRVITDVNESIRTMVSKYGLVGAPGLMFRSGPEALPLIRLTAASTVDEILKVGQILEKLLDDAKK